MINLGAHLGEDLAGFEGLEVNLELAVLLVCVQCSNLITLGNHSVR
jgi:hypothetical protein